MGKKNLIAMKSGISIAPIEPDSSPSLEITFPLYTESRNNEVIICMEKV